MSFLVFFACYSFAHAAERIEPVDKNGDGKPDRWLSYDEKNHLKRVAKDTNLDGKPDQFQEMLKGRSLVLVEIDRNFDGKIDRRTLKQWDANRRVPMMEGNKLRYLPTPSYRTVWKEEDKDFDGKMDVVKGKK